jgi:hypothetical protein
MVMVIGDWSTARAGAVFALRRSAFGFGRNGFVTRRSLSPPEVGNDRPEAVLPSESGPPHQSVGSADSVVAADSCRCIALSRRSIPVRRVHVRARCGMGDWSDSALQTPTNHHSYHITQLPNRPCSFRKHHMLAGSRFTFDARLPFSSADARWYSRSCARIRAREPAGCARGFADTTRLGGAGALRVCLRTFQLGLRAYFARRFPGDAPKFTWMRSGWRDPGGLAGTPESLWWLPQRIQSRAARCDLPALDSSRFVHWLVHPFRSLRSRLCCS